MQNIYVFWKRIFAFITDTVLLGIFGFILCKLFYNQLFKMGNWAIVVGFVIFVLYYGLQNSRICKGQTLGKRLFKVKIVSQDGKYLSLQKSLLRALILTPIFIFGDLDLFNYPKIALLWKASVVLFAFIQSVMFLINIPDRQMIHDMVVKTICVNADTQKIEFNKQKEVILNVAIAMFIIGAVLILLLRGAIYRNANINMTEVMKNKDTVKNYTRVNLVNINENKYYTANYAINVPDANVKDANLCMFSMTSFVNNMLRNDKNLMKYSDIVVTVIQNINLGIYKETYNTSSVGSPQEWLETSRLYYGRLYY